MSEILKQIDDERKERIKSFGDTYDERNIYCPYCAHKQDDIWEWDLTPNKEEREAQCQSCDRHFSYRVGVRYSTRRLK